MEPLVVMILTPTTPGTFQGNLFAIKGVNGMTNFSPRLRGFLNQVLLFFSAGVSLCSSSANNSGGILMKFLILVLLLHHQGMVIPLIHFLLNHCLIQIYRALLLHLEDNPYFRCIIWESISYVLSAADKTSNHCL